MNGADIFTRCFAAINPVSGREAEFGYIPPADKKKKVVLSAAVRPGWKLLSNCLKRSQSSFI